MNNTRVLSFVHSFFIIKHFEYYHNNYKVVNEFKAVPSLEKVSKKFNLDVGEIYSIIRTNNLNELNCNIITIKEETNKCRYMARHQEYLE